MFSVGCISRICDEEENCVIAGIRLKVPSSVPDGKRFYGVFVFSGPLKIDRFVIFYFDMTIPAVAKPLSVDRGEEKVFWANLGEVWECDISPRNPELCQAEFRKNTKKPFRVGSQRGLLLSLS
jgi:hypothetical protein